jgi:hypothetical protein
MDGRDEGMPFSGLLIVATASAPVMTVVETAAAASATAAARTVAGSVFTEGTTTAVRGVDIGGRLNGELGAAAAGELGLLGAGSSRGGCSSLMGADLGSGA